jgi:hypothetical protein
MELLPPSTVLIHSAPGLGKEIPPDLRHGNLTCTVHDLTWTCTKQPSKSVRVLFSAITGVQKNPDTQSEAKLRIALNKEAPIVCEFVTPTGAPDRESRQRFLDFRTRLNGTGGKAPATNAASRDALLPVKQALLSSHPALRQRHTQLVVSGVLTDDEFWSSHRQQLVDATLHDQKVCSESRIFRHEIKPVVGLLDCCAAACRLHFRLPCLPLKDS